VDATIATLDIQAKVAQMCANTHFASVPFWNEESVIELNIRKKNLHPDAQAASGCTRRSGRSGRTLAEHIPLPM